MIRFLLGILLLIGSSLLLEAQEISNKESDSIEAVLRHAFQLNNKSEYVKSIKISRQVLRYIEGTKRYGLMGMANNCLAYSYAELKDKDKAFEYSFKARDYYIKAKDTTSTIITYSNIGVTYQDFEMIKEEAITFQEVNGQTLITNQASTEGKNYFLKCLYASFFYFIKGDDQAILDSFKVYAEKK